MEWKWTDNPILAYRVPTMVMSALSIWLTWLFGVMFGGRLAGWTAALAFLFMPRFIFHAHLACFDAPATFKGSLACMRLFAQAPLLVGACVRGPHRPWLCDQT